MQRQKSGISNHFVPTPPLFKYFPIFYRIPVNINAFMTEVFIIEKPVHWDFRHKTVKVKGKEHEMGNFASFGCLLY